MLPKLSRLCICYAHATVCRQGRMTDWAQYIKSLRNCAIIALQGTRVPQRETELECIQTQNYTVYHSGYNKVCSSHSGVSIIVNHKFICPKSIHSYWIPSEHKLQGRILGIRIRGERYDTMHITIYYPPYTTDYSNQLCAQICKSVEKCIQELPNRCMPVLYFDGNSSLGKLRPKWEQ